MTRSRYVILAGISHVAAFAFIARFIPVDAFSTMDLYFDYGSRLRAGQVPYRDFVLEYPPLAAPLFWLPALVAADLTAYRAAFALQLLAIDLCGVGVGLWVTPCLPRRAGAGAVSSG